MLTLKVICCRIPWICVTRTTLENLSENWKAYIEFFDYLFIRVHSDCLIPLN